MNMPDTTQQMGTLEDVSRALGISTRTARKYVKDGIFKAYRHSYKMTRYDIQQCIDAFKNAAIENMEAAK